MADGEVAHPQVGRPRLGLHLLEAPAAPRACDVVAAGCHPVPRLFAHGLRPQRDAHVPVQELQHGIQRLALLAPGNPALPGAALVGAHDGHRLLSGRRTHGVDHLRLVLVTQEEQLAPASLRYLAVEPAPEALLREVRANDRNPVGEGVHHEVLVLVLALRRSCRGSTCLESLPRDGQLSVAKLKPDLVHCTLGLSIANPVYQPGLSVRLLLWADDAGLLACSFDHRADDLRLALRTHH
mmetsp:Transcript_61748/g.175375  ORF Transcript_61748/g.175375 Transcript_61748/m.175375 type:complete len:239 (-) Transcript_61748:36-752(-)